MTIDNRDIFEQIGNVFYAVAVDQHVQPIEIAELKLLISNDWVPGSSGEALVSDEAHCILMTIDSLLGAGTTASLAFKDFQTFYRNHPEVFTMDLKQRIVKSARDIVKLFRGNNKKSNPHFEELKKLFELNKQITL